MNRYGCRCGQVHAPLQRLQAVTLRSGVLRRGPTVLCGLLFHVEVPPSLSQASGGSKWSRHAGPSKLAAQRPWEQCCGEDQPLASPPTLQAQEMEPVWVSAGVTSALPGREGQFTSEGQCIYPRNSNS